MLKLCIKIIVIKIYDKQYISLMMKKKKKK